MLRRLQSAAREAQKPGNWPDFARGDLSTLGRELAAALPLTAPLEQGGESECAGGVHCLCALLQHALRCLRVVKERYSVDKFTNQTVHEEVVLLRQLLSKIVILQPILCEEMEQLAASSAPSPGLPSVQLQSAQGNASHSIALETLSTTDAARLKKRLVLLYPYALYHYNY